MTASAEEGVSDFTRYRTAPDGPPLDPDFFIDASTIPDRDRTASQARR